MGSRGVTFASIESLPEPVRKYLDAVRTLYQTAGMSTREIEKATTTGFHAEELRDVVTRSTVLNLLNNKSVVSWPKVESFVRVACKHAFNRPDPDAEVARIHSLYVQAYGNAGLQEEEPKRPNSQDSQDPELRVGKEAANGGSIEFKDNAAKYAGWSDEHIIEGLRSTMDFEARVSITSDLIRRRDADNLAAIFEKLDQPGSDDDLKDMILVAMVQDEDSEFLIELFASLLLSGLADEADRLLVAVINEHTEKVAYFLGDLMQVGFNGHTLQALEYAVQSSTRDFASLLSYLNIAREEEEREEGERDIFREITLAAYNVAAKHLSKTRLIKLLVVLRSDIIKNNYAEDILDLVIQVKTETFLGEMCDALVSVGLLNDAEKVSSGLRERVLRRTSGL